MRTHARAMRSTGAGGDGRAAEIIQHVGGVIVKWEWEAGGERGSTPAVGVVDDLALSGTCGPDWPSRKHIGHAIYPEESRGHTLCRSV